MRRSRLALCVLVGLVAGLGGETLLFMQRQCRAAERSLREDFRVVLFLRSDVDAGKQKVLEEQLRALPDVSDVRSLSGQDQLARLRQDDPELVDSVALIGDNPLTPAFEVSLDGGGIARIAQWLAQAQPLADWADVRYKPAQAQAILQAQFYARFLDLALAALVCLGAALALAGLWSPGRPAPSQAHAQPHGQAHGHPHGHPHEHPHEQPQALARRDGLTAAALAAAGCAAGALLVCVMVLPLRSVAPWWGWPPVAGQLALILGGASAGWVLCGRPE